MEKQINPLMEYRKSLGNGVTVSMMARLLDRHVTNVWSYENGSKLAGKVVLDKYEQITPDFAKYRMFYENYKKLMKKEKKCQKSQ